jgi:hypothetical protein
VTVLGLFILSCEIINNGLQFFGEIKELIALAAPVALFPQPTYYELQYKQQQIDLKKTNGKALRKSMERKVNSEVVDPNVGWKRGKMATRKAKKIELLGIE